MTRGFMDQLAVLCEKDRYLLYEFSRRCITRLTAFSRFFLPIKVITSYLDTNVQKETEKDRLIIEHAAEAFRSGKDLCTEEIDNILEITKTVDSRFVKKLMIPPLSIRLRYDEIEPVRKKRICCLGKCVKDILVTWNDGERFEDGLKRAYSETGFRDALTEILHLYNLETRMVNKCVRTLPPFDRGLSRFAESLFHTMEEVTHELVDSCSEEIFGKAPGHAKS